MLVLGSGSNGSVLWGAFRVFNGDKLVSFDIGDASDPGNAEPCPMSPAQRRAFSDLVQLLLDPAAYLPASAWEDQRINGFVPSRYAVCFGSSGTMPVSRSRTMNAPPSGARDLIVENALGVSDPGWNDEAVHCRYQVTTDDARAIVALLDSAGLQREGPDYHWLAYRVPLASDPERVGTVFFLTVLPDGEVVCACG